MTKNEATMMMGIGMLMIGAAMVEMEQRKEFRFDTKRRMSWVDFGSKLCDLCFSGKISEDQYNNYNEQAWEIIKKDFSKEEKEIFLANLYEEIRSVHC